MRTIVAPLLRTLRWPSLRGRRIELDFVRGIAILLACGWHFNREQTGITALDWLLAPGRKMGWAGVDLFFVLSGFLIGGLLFSEYAKRAEFKPRRFLIRRAFKIWPILYSFLALQLLLDQHPWQSYFFQCLFHVQNYMLTPLSHLWSLAVEEQFYLVFAIVYSVMLAVAGSPRAMPWLLVGTMVGVLLIRSIAVMQGINGDAMMQTQFRIDALACGVLLSYLQCFHRPLFDRMASYKALLAVFWIGGATIIFNSYAFGAFMQSIGFTLVYLSAAGFLLFCYDMPLLKAGSWPVRLVSQIGLFSYAIYVCQYAAVRPAISLTAHLPITASASTAVRVALDYAGAFAAGMIVTVIIERPALSLRNRLFPDDTVHAVQGENPPPPSRVDDQSHPLQPAKSLT